MFVHAITATNPDGSRYVDRHAPFPNRDEFPDPKTALLMGLLSDVVTLDERLAALEKRVTGIVETLELEGL